MPKVSTDHLEAKRYVILQAAVACFAVKGFHNTTMSDIAEMAGVSDGLAYRYFSGKDEIIEEAVRQSAGQLPFSIDERDEIEDVRERIDFLVRQSFTRFDSPDREATVSLRIRSWAEALDNEDVKKQLVGRWKFYEPIEENMFRQAQDEGLVSEDLDPRAIAVLGMAIHDGLDFRKVLDPSVDVDKCKEVVLAMFRGLFQAKDGTSSSS